LPNRRCVWSGSNSCMRVTRVTGHDSLIPCPQRRSGHYTIMHRFSLIFGIELCESLRDVSRKIVVFYRDFSL
jgi:hypothetical protein